MHLWNHLYSIIQTPRFNYSVQGWYFQGSQTHCSHWISIKVRQVAPLGSLEIVQCDLTEPKPTVNCSSALLHIVSTPLSVTAPFNVLIHMDPYRDEIAAFIYRIPWGSLWMNWIKKLLMPCAKYLKNILFRNRFACTLYFLYYFSLRLESLWEQSLLWGSRPRFPLLPGLSQDFCYRV